MRDSAQWRYYPRSLHVGRPKMQDLFPKNEVFSKGFIEHEGNHDVDLKCTLDSIELVGHEYEVRWRTVRSRISSGTSSTFAIFKSYAMSLESESVMKPGSRAKEIY